MTRPRLRRILCVDDERDILDVARMCLQMVGGFEVTCCDSGRAALDQVVVVMPDLILLDVMMPDMNGPDTLAALRARPELQHIPVVFMTARVQAAEIKAYLKLGITSVIPKPFDPMKLAAEVQKVWDACQTTPDPVDITMPALEPVKRAASPPEPAAELDPLADRMDQLRVLYIDTLKSHATHLQAIIATTRTGVMAQDDRALLKSIAHKLVGTGTTYGFAVISQTGRALDDLIIANPAAHVADLLALAGPLYDACVQAIQGSPAPVAQPVAPPPPISAGAFGRRPVAPATPLPLILVADDDDAVRQLFSGLFVREARMIEAINCEQALTMMRHYGPDLLLLDDIMPGSITGLKFMEDLQKTGEFAHMPIHHDHRQQFRGQYPARPQCWSGRLYHQAVRCHGRRCAHPAWC